MSPTIVKKSTITSKQKEYFKTVFYTYLDQNKMRRTEQRRLILEAVLNSDKHVDAETISQNVKKLDSSLGVATVYRALRMMTDAKLLVERFFDGARARFEFVDSIGEHHDHIICLHCKKIVEFFNDDLENLQIKISEDLGFNLKNHRMEMFGVCAQCQQSQQN